MNFVSIDSITEKPNISLFIDNKYIDCYDNCSSSSYIPDGLNSLLRNNAIDIKLLNYIAVTIGPGSYTGIRVGLSIAQGIAFSLSIPLVPINTMNFLYSAAKATNNKEFIIGFPAYDNNIFYFNIKDGEISSGKLKNIDSFKGKSIFGIQLDKYKDIINYNEINFSSRLLGNYSIENYDSLQTEDISSISPVYLDKFTVEKRAQSND